MLNPALVVIAGPTGVGKTRTAVALARLLPAEIICADSRTLYVGMDIGTAKPTAVDRQAVPHHLLDVARPDRIITLAEYQHLAETAIGDIRDRARLPLLVGGTGLYIRAVVDGLLIPSAAPDWGLRAELEAEERVSGPGTLHRRLSEVDPGSAERIHPHNLRRIIRALEVHAQTGVSISALQRSRGGPGSPGSAVHGPVVMIALTLERARLHARLHRRIEEQLAAGLVDEVRALVQAGYSKTLPALQGIGYKEIAAYLEGALSFPEAVALFHGATRRYAKRQLTWFRADPRYRWLDVGDDPPEVVAARIHDMMTM